MNQLASVAALFTLLTGFSASAAGIPTLKNTAKRAVVSQRLPGQDLRVRAPKNATLRMWADGGMLDGFTAVKAVKQTRTGKIFSLSPGQYQYGKKTFRVEQMNAIFPRGK